MHNALIARAAWKKVSWKVPLNAKEKSGNFQDVGFGLSIKGKERRDRNHTFWLAKSTLSNSSYINLFLRSNVQAEHD
jgi:hypothetical protein